MKDLIASSGVITNPVINPDLGTGGFGTSADRLAKFIALLWQVIFILSGLAVILFMASGALLWITSGGDKAKVESARERITTAVIGMTVLFCTFAIINFVFPAIGFDILAPELPDNLTNPGPVAT